MDATTSPVIPDATPSSAPDAVQEPVGPGIEPQVYVVTEEEVVRVGLEDEALETALLERRGSLWVRLFESREIGESLQLATRLGLDPTWLDELVAARAPVASRQDHGDGRLAVLPLPSREAGTTRIGALRLLVRERLVVTIEPEWRSPALAAVASGLTGRGADLRGLLQHLTEAVVAEWAEALDAWEQDLEQLTSRVTGPRPDALRPERLLALQADLERARLAVAELGPTAEVLARTAPPDLARLGQRPPVTHVAAALTARVAVQVARARHLSTLWPGVMGRRTFEAARLVALAGIVFLPLIFVASIYAMNFAPHSSPFNMPELTAYWGYPAALLVMGLLAMGLLSALRRRGWLGVPPDEDGVGS